MEPDLISFIERLLKTLKLRLDSHLELLVCGAGESNLKIRRPVDIKGDTPGSAAAAAQLLGMLACEQPSPDLHAFIGNFTYRPASGALPCTPLAWHACVNCLQQLSHATP